MEGPQSFSQWGSAAAAHPIHQLPPQSNRDVPSSQEVGALQNYQMHFMLSKQQKMKKALMEQQEQDSMGVTHPSSSDSQVNHRNYPQHLPGYSRPTFPIAMIPFTPPASVCGNSSRKSGAKSVTSGGQTSPRYSVGSSGTTSGPLPFGPGQPIQQQTSSNVEEIRSSSFPSASYLSALNHPQSPRYMFHGKNSQISIKSQARPYFNRQESLREGRPAGSNNGCSDIDEVHDNVGLSTSDSSTATSSWNSEDFIFPFFDPTFEPALKPLPDVDSETALAGLAFPVNEWHGIPITLDYTSPGVLNTPSQCPEILPLNDELFQTTHLVRNKYGAADLIEEEMGSWTQFSSSISSSAAQHPRFSQAPKAAVVTERRKPTKAVGKAENRHHCKECGKSFSRPGNLKRHQQQKQHFPVNVLGNASHVRQDLSHGRVDQSSPGSESQRPSIILNEPVIASSDEHDSWDRCPSNWSDIKSRAAQLKVEMTDEQYKECAAKINELADVRPIGLDDADNFTRAFHRDLIICREFDDLPNMTVREKAVLKQKEKKRDIPEKRAIDVAATPSGEEVAPATDTEGPAALVCEEANPTSAKSRSQSSVSTTIECNNTMQSSPGMPDFSLTRNNTLSSFTEDDTDWGEDEITGSLQDLHFVDFSAFSEEGLFSQDQMKETLMRPVFSPMKQELIDRIMKEFWAIFDQESGAILNHSPVTGPMEADETPNDNKETTCEGGEDSKQNTSSNSFSETTNSQKSTGRVLGRHSRDGEDDDQDNGDERSPKKPRTFLSPPQIQDDNTKFACPYRKRDPRKYCVQHWRSCALTPLESVARVKAHLYRHHRIFPCQRCKELFKNQDEVNLHLKNPKGCELRNIEHADGVTAEIVEKLRSKKKAQRDQTEGERWQDIYKLLFPNEMIPDPYFEAIQEDPALSPDSRELANYEEYCRRELPRDFRAALEQIVNNQSQPIEENIRNQLTNIVRDCQDRVFSRYKSSAGTAAVTPSRNPTSLDSPMISMGDTRTDMSLTTNGTAELSFGRITPPFFQPPSPQSHLGSRLEVSDLQNDTPKPPDGKDPSDSGYSSNASGLQSQLPSSFHNTSESSSLLNPQPIVVSSGQVPANAPSTWDLDNGLLMNPGNDVMNGDSTSTFNQSWLDFNSQLAEGNAWNSFRNNVGMEDAYPSDQPL